MGFVLLVSFLSGFQIGKTQSKNINQANLRGMNRTPDMTRNNMRLNNNVMGEIIEINDTTLTLKLRDSGSKIVIVSKETEIFKTVNVEKDVLKVGENIAVEGKTNDDGSVSATSLRLIDNMSVRQNMRAN